eukprot:TRINITY_DN1449_c0_g1_i4.p1 TRINITY_DN1449_c0_g1~~TRINITY_DN1449_c0_g1_i4.p1  ORF type:complete len:150 (+),score=38.77 TRINITY_DN1449_c0_g1_i4:115-564(+)
MDLIRYFYEHPLKIKNESTSPTSLQAPCFSIIQSELSASCAKSLEGADASSKVETNPENSPRITKRTDISLIDKLNAIMESTKKKAKAMRNEVKYKRRRKTKEQLKVLNEEVEKREHISNKRIEEISKETGLTKLQVYKWYWDLKHKQE